MRKFAFNITITALLAGIIGGVLRYFYLTRAVEPDTGLPMLGSAPHVALVAFVVLVVVLVFALSYIVWRFFGAKEDFRDMLTPVNSFYRVTTGIAALLIFIAGAIAVVPAFKGGTVSYAALIQAVLMMLTGGCLIGLSHESYGKKPLRGAYFFSIVPEIAMTYWLLIYYRTTQINPTLLTYVFIALALAASAFAFYFMAAAVFGRRSPARFVFSHCLAIFFPIMSLFDGIPIYYKLCFIGLAVYFAVNLVRYLGNLQTLKKTRQTTAATEEDI